MRKTSITPQLEETIMFTYNPTACFKSTLEPRQQKPHNLVPLLPPWTDVAHSKLNQSWHFIILSLVCFLQVCLPCPWPCDCGCSVYIKTDIIEIVGGRKCRAQPVVVNLSYCRESRQQRPMGGSTLEAWLTALCCSWQRASPTLGLLVGHQQRTKEGVMYGLTSDFNLWLCS